MVTKGGGEGGWQSEVMAKSLMALQLYSNANEVYISVVLWVLPYEVFALCVFGSITESTNHPFPLFKRKILFSVLEGKLQNAHS